MNRIKSTFKRRASTKSSNLEFKRSGAFLKKLEESKSLDEPESEGLTDPPTLDKSDLSIHEINAYEAWWGDLDPFDIGKADNQAVFQFVFGSGLSDATLEKIFSLYPYERDGLTREEFFALLRLIAHAQHGRTVNRDIVYLGVPLPSFQTKPIDALIKRSPHYDRLSMLPLDRPASLDSNTLLDTPTTNTQQHSRSKSVPFNFQFTTAAVNHPGDIIRSPAQYQLDTTSASEMKKSQQSSHSSLDSLQKMMDTGQSLLLTQSFKPNFSMDDDNNSNSGSSQHDNSSNLSYRGNNPYLANPFETDESTATTPQLELTMTPLTMMPQSPPPEKSALCHHLVNSFYNINRIPPPPVPPQSTKPAYPKYARRV